MDNKVFAIIIVVVILYILYNGCMSLCEKKSTLKSRFDANNECPQTDNRIINGIVSKIDGIYTGGDTAGQLAEAKSPNDMYEMYTVSRKTPMTGQPNHVRNLWKSEDSAEYNVDVDAYATHAMVRAPTDKLLMASKTMATSREVLRDHV
jgi:hypothetical protein